MLKLPALLKGVVVDEIHAVAEVDPDEVPTFHERIILHATNDK